jgi:hypothetical protein
MKRTYEFLRRHQAAIQIATLSDDNKVTLASIVVGRDLGKTIELASGLPVGTRFVTNLTDTLRDGTAVSIDQADAAKKGHNHESFSQPNN